MIMISLKSYAHHEKQNEKKIKSPVSSEGMHSHIHFFLRAEYKLFLFHVMSKTLVKHTQQWFVPVSYYFLATN